MSFRKATHLGTPLAHEHYTEGKVTGDKVAFVVNMGPKAGLVFAHEGEIHGDEIQLTMKPSGEFPGSTVVAKKIK